MVAKAVKPREGRPAGRPDASRRGRREPSRRPAPAGGKVPQACLEGREPRPRKRAGRRSCFWPDVAGTRQHRSVRAARARRAARRGGPLHERGARRLGRSSSVPLRRGAASPPPPSASRARWSTGAAARPTFPGSSTRARSRAARRPRRPRNDLAATASSIPEDRLAASRDAPRGRARPDGEPRPRRRGDGLGEAFAPSRGRALPVGPRKRPLRTRFGTERRDRDAPLPAGAFGRVSWSGVLSGPGLVNTTTSRVSRGAPRRGAGPRDRDGGRDLRRDSAWREPRGPRGRDLRRGASQDSARAHRGPALFASTVRAEAGNLALKTLATGGGLLGAASPRRSSPRCATGRSSRRSWTKGDSASARRDPRRVILDERARCSAREDRPGLAR